MQERELAEQELGQAEQEREEEDEDGLGEDDEQRTRDGSDAESVEFCAPAPVKFNMGNLAAAGLASAAAKKKPKTKKAAKAAEEGDDDLLDTGDGETMSAADFMKMIESRNDVKMKQIFKELDNQPHTCLQALFPDVVLIQKMKVGHQIKGVPWFLLRPIDLLTFAKLGL